MIESFKLNTIPNFEQGEIIVIDKPLTWSSFDVVNKIRYKLREVTGNQKIKVGHAGTLDPLATGVLVICTGKYTKLIEQLQEGEKVYEATFRLGATTPSYDMETEVDKNFEIDNIKEEDVIRAYHNLYKIEESFRIMKNSLEVEPIFVWTPKRIKGHFVICFLAFLLARHLEYKLAINNISASTDKIRKALNSLNFAKVSLDENSYYIKTKAEDLAHKILRILKIPSPKNITPEEELNL
mgnify:CR=1 FL=1